jgi:hypothetical protein
MYNRITCPLRHLQQLFLLVNTQTTENKQGHDILLQVPEKQFITPQIISAVSPRSTTNGVHASSCSQPITKICFIPEQWLVLHSTLFISKCYCVYTSVCKGNLCRTNQNRNFLDISNRKLLYWHILRHVNIIYIHVVYQRMPTDKTTKTRT